MITRIATCTVACALTGFILLNAVDLTPSTDDRANETPTEEVATTDTTQVLDPAALSTPHAQTEQRNAERPEEPAQLPEQVDLAETATSELPPAQEEAAEPAPAPSEPTVDVAEPVSKQPETAATTDVEAEVLRTPQLPQVDKIADSVTVQLDGKAPLVGRGRPITRPLPLPYVTGKLRQVSFVFQFSDDPAAAADELDALVQVGARLTDKTGDLSLKVNDAGQRLLDQHGAASIELPAELWPVMFRTAEASVSESLERIRPINKGQVRLRIGRYSADQDAEAYALMINRQDVRFN